MELLIAIGKLIGGLAVLTIGADLLVRGASKFALGMGVKPVVIGLTLVAYGTSAPELVVSVDAAVRGDAGISIGNVVGSNIGNIGLILGLVALIKPIKFHPELFGRDIPVMLAAAALLGLLPFIGGPVVVGEGNAFLLRWWIGVLFLIMLAVLQLRMIRLAARDDPQAAKQRAGWGPRLLMLLLAALGLAALVGGGKVFVDAAVDIATMAGLSKLVIGLTIVAVGTSLPELATSLVAAARGQSDLASGNVVGSNIFNILLILGVTALIIPVPIEARAMELDIPVMLVFSMVLVLLTWRKKQLGRADGGILLGLYGLYVANLLVGWV